MATLDENLLPEPTQKQPENLNVLLVEGDPRRRRRAARIVRGSGREVVQCGTVADAIRTLETQRIDLVLISVRLPDQTGIGLMQWIRDRRLDLAVIVVNGDESIESVVSALRCGAREYIPSPYEPAHLRRTVDDALAARKLAREASARQAEIERSEHLHRYLVDQSPDLIFLLDPEGRFWFVNERFASLLGFQKEELIGAHYAVVVHHDDLKHARCVCSERRTGSRAMSNVELRLRRRTAEGAEVGSVPFATVVVSAKGIYAESADGDPARRRFLGTYGVARDITDRKQVEQLMSFHASHDALTGLPNRSLFIDRLRQAIARARRMFLEKGYLAVMFIDLDQFKAVNDKHGHVKGDQLLQQVALRLRRSLRGSDTLSRLGGDEFVALVAELRSRDAADAVATKILNGLREPFLLGNDHVRISASIGIAVYPDDGDSDLELMRNADLAMYSVKQSGRDSISYFTRDMSPAFRQKIELENELRAAIARGAVELHYQPIHNVATGRVEALEALVRWRHPIRGLMEPGEFLQIAEESGLILTLGEHVLNAACTNLQRWHAQGFGALRIAVNLSAREFDRPDLVDFVIDTLKRHAVAPESVELEIPEGALVEDLDAITDRAGRLRRAGVRIAIDDFGTRYSTLGYLPSLPISGIKIDHSFVRDLVGRAATASIVSAMVGIASGFGLSLVAEGVEKPEQVDLLRACGCDVMQGFHFSRPLPAAQVADYLARF